MADEKKLGDTTNGFFVGKELFNEGSKNGKAWKMYKLKFKPTMDSDKRFTMTVFNEAKAKGTKTLAQLEEGKQYKIIYEEKEAVNNDGIPFISKTAYGFYSVVDGKKKEIVMSPTEYATQVLNVQLGKLDLTQFDSFKERYLVAVKKANMQPNPVHMLGSFIASSERDRVKELIEKCKEALKS